MPKSLVVVVFSSNIDLQTHGKCSFLMRLIVCGKHSWSSKDFPRNEFLSSRVHFACVFRAVNTLFAIGKYFLELIAVKKKDKFFANFEVEKLKKVTKKSQCLAMAGFLERKPSKLLQDVKTKSIERTLLPLIKQVSELRKPFPTTTSSSGFLTQNENEQTEKFSIFRFHSCVGGMENWMESENQVLWMRRRIILVFVGCYFKIPAMCVVNYVYRLLNNAWKGFTHSLSRSSS